LRRPPPRKLQLEFCTRLLVPPQMADASSEVAETTVFEMPPPMKLRLAEKTTFPVPLHTPELSEGPAPGLTSLNRPPTTTA